MQSVHTAEGKNTIIYIKVIYRPLFLGDIEDYGKSKTIVCPYHQYEFELSNGNCLQEDFQICSLKVEIIDDSLFLLLPNLAKLLSLEPITRPIKSLNEEVEVDLTKLNY